MTNYRVPAEEILNNVLLLIKSDYETVTVPRIEAYVHWAKRNDAFFTDGDEFSNNFNRQRLKEAQEYLEANS